MKRLSALLLALLLIVVSVSGCVTTNEERLAQFERDLAVFQEYIESIGNASYTNDQSINQLEYDLDSLTEYIYGYDPANSSYPGGFWSPPKDVPTATAYVLSNDVPARIRAAARGMKQVYGDLIQICNGVNDHVEIQAAVDALPAGGAEVRFSFGTYYVEASLVQDSYQTWGGCGRSTIFTTTTANLDIITATGGAGTEKTGILLRDFVIDGNSYTSDIGILFTYVDNSEIANIYTYDTDEDGISLITSDYNSIHDCTLTNSDDNCGVRLNESIYNIIANNHLYDNAEDGVLLDNGSNYNNVENNVMTNNANCGVAIGTSGDVSIHNIVTGNTFTGGYWRGAVYLWTDCNYNTVSDNTIVGGPNMGIHLDEADYNIISDNSVMNNGCHGIDIDSSDNNEVTGNYCIANGQESDNSYDNIRIRGDYNSVQHNTCRVGGEANEPRYGIEIYAVGDIENLVSNNDLYDSGQTANLVDDGTDSIIRNNRGYASQTFEFSFVAGTLYDDMGWDIDLGTEYATAFAQIPEDVASITLMRIWAYSVVTEADAMRLEISMNGAGDNEAWNTHAYAGANVNSASTNFAATDIIYWEITDAAVLALTASDSVVVKVIYEDAGNGDCATDARFRCVEFEYE